MLSYLPVYVLLAVFVHHRLQVSRRHQHVWKGGGFGMFADIHRTSVVADLAMSDGDATLMFHHAAARADPVSVRPTDRNMMAWGRKLLADPAHASRDSTVRRSHDQPLTAVRLTMHQLTLSFDGRTGTHSASNARTLVVDCSASSRAQPSP